MLASLKNRIGINPLAWLQDTWRMRQIVRQFDTRPDRTAPGLRFVVVITPWVGSTVPWLSLGIGLLLARHASPVTFVIDDLPFGRHPLRYAFVLRCIRFVAAALRAGHRVVDLSSLPSNAAAAAQAGPTIETLARLNAVWEMRGEKPSSAHEAFAALCTSQLMRAYGPIASVLRPGSADVMFVPGGVYGNSGLWVFHARKAGMRIATYDNGGSGALMLAVNGIASQMQDIPAAFRTLQARCQDPQELAFVVEEARHELQQRRAGVDVFAYQIPGSASVDNRFDGAVLIALNSSWDSAALGLHTVFRDNQDWIVETTRFLLAHTGLTVIVRQHPAERMAYARSNDDYADMLVRNFGNHPRLQFIAAEEKINSYDLLDRVAAVVVYTSTIGVEAAAYGKPVITPSNSYYSGLGFVHRAANLDDYQAQLASIGTGALAVTDTMRQDAMLCYYVTQVCNWVFSPFNPAEFHVWSRIGLDRLQVDAKIRGLVRALQDNVPIATLNHQDRFAARDHGTAPAT